MRTNAVLTTWLLCLLAPTLGAADARAAGLPGLVPKPVRAEALPGTFLITTATRIVVEKNASPLADVARFLAATLRQSTGYPLPVDIGAGPQGEKNAIVLSLGPGGANRRAEGYLLSVTSDRIRIAAAAPAGAFYALQTLLQLLPKEVEYGSPVYGFRWEVPCATIDDGPRFPWRGMHLDVGRHFAPKEFVKKYIDLLSRYKFNVFHWHLTEDQGWRIEIKKYPLLTTVGSWRAETLGDGRPHGGFYTQEDIREVVAYAQQRFVTIVPEIEMPGHSVAALASYPELSCTGGPFQVQTKWRVFDDVFCAGNDRTFEFLEGVLTEVMALFPGTYIHCGGDECPKARWKACPKCQARMKAEGLRTEHELQSYFIKRIEKFLNEHGRRLVGWDEILEGGLAPNATVMSWRGTEGGIAAAQSGHDVVMSPTSHCYFDYSQGLTGEPVSWGGYLPLERVYSYEPVPAALSEAESKHILGAQGNVWTEYIDEAPQIEYMAFPRACALAEVVWSDRSARDFQDFSQRMAVHYDRLHARDVNVRIPSPGGFEGTRILFADTVVSVTNPVPGAEVRFTTDGSVPHELSPLAPTSIAVHSTMTIRARTFLPDGRTSPVATGRYSRIDRAQHGIAFRVQDAPPGVAASGVTYQIALQGIPLQATSARLEFDGGLDVEKEGLYTFALSSSGVSSLAIDTYPVVSDTMTAQWWKVPSGRAYLTPGMHQIHLAVDRGVDGLYFDLQIEGPGMERQTVPAWMLRRMPVKQ